MNAEKQAGLTRIVALRPCGHVAAFRNVEELLRGQERCPVCDAAKMATAREQAAAEVRS